MLYNIGIDISGRGRDINDTCLHVINYLPMLGITFPYIFFYFIQFRFRMRINRVSMTIIISHMTENADLSLVRFYARVITVLKDCLLKLNNKYLRMTSTALLFE